MIIPFPVRRTTAIAIAATLFAATAWAASANDAGSGADAPDTRAEALAVPLGSHEGNLSPRDVDWYSVAASASSPVCVSATHHAHSNQTVTFSTTSASGEPKDTRTVVREDETRAMGFATTSLERVHYGIEPSDNDPNQGDPARPGGYGFSLATQGPSSLSSGDALTGGDAGATTDGALPLDAGCTGGTLRALTGLGDDRDVYAFTADAGDLVWYSLGAATGAAIELELLDAAGDPVGLAIGAGDAAGYYVPDGGSFYLATSTTSLDDLSYLIGITIGPDPPGSGCRPYCLS